MFLVNSRFPLVSATLHAPPVQASHIRSPFFRSYGGILPSSFTTIHSNALVFSTYLPVSVSGTGGISTRSRSFSWQYRITHWPPIGVQPSRLTRMGCGFAYTPCHTLSPGQPTPGMSYLSASLRSLPTTSLGQTVTTHQSPKGPAAAPSS